MYALVADIESYPRFLPWCGSAVVRQRLNLEEIATLEIVRGVIRLSLTTRNRMRKAEGIDIDLVEGPFERLRGRWRFAPLAEQGCKVSLEIEFEFASSMVRASIGPVFNDVASDMVDAFCRRAVMVYGER